VFNIFGFISATQKGQIVEIQMKQGLAPVFMVFCALFRGSSYSLLAEAGSCSNKNEYSLIARVAAMRNRWLYKYAMRIVVNSSEIKFKVERESAGLDVPVVFLRDVTF